MAATDQRTAGGGARESGSQKQGATGNAAAWTPRLVADELRLLLERLSATYTAMLRTLDSHAAAVSAADALAVGRCVADQEQLLGEVGKLDQRRREILAGACVCVPALATAAKGCVLTVTQVAGALPVDDRDALVEAGRRVRELVESAKKRSEAIRVATVTMVAHIEGLMRHVGRKLSHSGTYGRRGVVEVGQQVVSALDMKT